MIIYNADPDRAEITEINPQTESMNRDTPVSVVGVFAEQPLQSSVFEGLVVIGRSAEGYDLIPNTWTDRERDH